MFGYLSIGYELYTKLVIILVQLQCKDFSTGAVSISGQVIFLIKRADILQ